MDEVNQGNRQGPPVRKHAPGAPDPVKRTRVLRAVDVIPPFDKYVSAPDPGSSVGEPVPSADDGETDPEPLAAQSCPAGNNEGGSEGHFTPGVPKVTGAPLSPDDAEIPAYDLAENILAEQRRAAGRRRRRPGRPVETQNFTSPTSGRDLGVRLSAPDLPTQDLQELQRVVTEIVAQDIARLCRRPVGPASGGAPLRRD